MGGFGSNHVRRLTPW